MKFELDEYKRNIPDDVLIDDLKNIAKMLQKDKLTTAAYKAATIVQQLGSNLIY